MTAPDGTLRVASRSMEVVWDPRSRLAASHYVPGTFLRRQDSALLVQALTEWIGPAPAPFGFLINAHGVHGTDADYRAGVSHFFREHRALVSIALYNVSPAVWILAEMFRIGTGVSLRNFRDEAAARAWLRRQGIAA